MASIKKEDQADKDIYKDWRVKRYARKLARQSAMSDLDLSIKMRQLDRQAHEKLFTLQRQYETERQLKVIEEGSDPISNSVVDLPKSDIPTLDLANVSRKLSKQDALNKTLQLLADNPTLSPSEIAEQIGRSRQTVYDYLDELKATRQLHQNGPERSVVN